MRREKGTELGREREYNRLLLSTMLNVLCCNNKITKLVGVAQWSFM